MHIIFSMLEFINKFINKITGSVKYDLNIEIFVIKNEKFMQKEGRLEENL